MDPQQKEKCSRVREEGYVRFVMRWTMKRFPWVYPIMTLPTLISAYFGKTPDSILLFIQTPLTCLLLLAIWSCGVWQTHEEFFLESERELGEFAQSNVVLFEEYLNGDRDRRFLEPKEQQRSFQDWLKYRVPGR